MYLRYGKILNIKMLKLCLSIQWVWKIYLEMFISPVVNTRRSLLGEDNQKTISLLSTKVPLITYSAMSGQKCFDWKVPQEWILKKAVLQDLNGNVLVDADDNILLFQNDQE